MRDLGDGLAWCEDCNVGWDDEDNEEEPGYCPHGELWADPCDDCAYDANEDAATLGDLLVAYVVAAGVVHAWDCDRAPRQGLVGWRASMAGLDDRACTSCLPGGLPRPGDLSAGR